MWITDNIQKQTHMMVATDTNAKNLRCNQHCSIYRVEKLTQLAYLVKQKLHSVSHKQRLKMSFPVHFKQTFHWYEN